MAWTSILKCGEAVVAGRGKPPAITQVFYSKVKLPSISTLTVHAFKNMFRLFYFSLDSCRTDWNITVDADYGSITVFLTTLPVLPVEAKHSYFVIYKNVNSRRNGNFTVVSNSTTRVFIGNLVRNTLYSVQVVAYGSSRGVDKSIYSCPIQVRTRSKFAYNII